MDLEPTPECMTHEKNPVLYVCVDENCKGTKLLCKLCIPKFHEAHELVSYDKFKLSYEKFQSVQCKQHETIINMFKDVTAAYQLCIKKAQDRTLKKFCSNYQPEAQADLAALEAQQLYGVTESILKVPEFRELVEGKKSDEVMSEPHVNLADLEINLDIMKSEIMLSINNFASKLASSNSQSPSKIKNQQLYQFSEILKSPLLRVEKNGQALRRASNLKEGLTVYGIVNRPLTKKWPTIQFQITHQEYRYIYFGVCDPKSFEQYQFEGRVYELGKRMYAIRQSSREAGRAVCLHNSQPEYSNKEVPAWDFKLGDRVQLEWNWKAGSIIFCLNRRHNFQMPLDNETEQFYPFVGLKYKDDEVIIVNEGEDLPPKKAQEILIQKKEVLAPKKGFLSKLYS